ncbi:MAG: penicillin-insensitive murein endopeptidase [Neomegalonema sp.]|nr:penicillin-insensitive murein endopeptidase [Neomegalonema sp.]
MHRLSPARILILPLALAAILLASVFGDRAGAQEAAKNIFSQLKQPREGQSASFGTYARGCLQGARALPSSGEGWQAMRPSRQRHFGHPDLIDFIGFLSQQAQSIGWPGLLIGDMAQARGGPMKGGHRSHQTGLDVDIWMRAAPDYTLSAIEREMASSLDMVAEDGRSVSSLWTGEHAALLKSAASVPNVARIFVNPAIKRALCDETSGRQDVEWLRKIRPWWGHRHHFHVRLKCPEHSSSCENQAPPPSGSGCGAELDWWFTADARVPKAKSAAKPLMLDDLPAQCRRVAEID